MAYRHHQWAGRHAVSGRPSWRWLIISAATAFRVANDLYDNYAWWFRVMVAVLAILVWWAPCIETDVASTQSAVTVAADGSWQ